MIIDDNLLRSIGRVPLSVRILPEIHEQAHRIGVKVFEPRDGRVVSIRPSTSIDLAFLIDFWGGKYEVHIEPFEYVIGVQYGNSGRIYDYPDNVVEIYHGGEL